MRKEELSSKRIALFGVGNNMRTNLKFLDAALNIVCFVDNNNSNWGKCVIDSRKCISPDAIKQEKIDYIIITVLNEKSICEIGAQLSSLGVEYCHINEVLDESIACWDQKEVERCRKNQHVQSFGNKIQRYVECYMDKQACNLRCEYCYVSQRREISNRVRKFVHTPEFIASALSPHRLGGISLIGLCCDGEPLISDDYVTLIKLLLQEGHYVFLISNGTISKSIDKLCELPKEAISRLFIRFSYHYFELKRLNLTKIFFENIQKVRACGGSISLLLVGSDDYIDYLDDIKDTCMKELGALPHIDMVRDEIKGKDDSLEIDSKYSYEEYIAIWEQFDSAFFKVKEKTKELDRGKCYAGKRVLHLELMTGEAKRCSTGAFVDNIYEDISKPINFYTEPKECPMKYCPCSSMFFALGSRLNYQNMPTIYELWNRETKDGTNWMNDESKEFFMQRFDEADIEG